jgi:plastocyanin
VEGKRGLANLAGWFAAIAGGLMLGALAACGGDDALTATPTTTPTSVTDGSVLLTPVTLRNYAFNPDRLSFEVGDTVDFAMISADEPHTFTVQALGINWMVAGGRKVNQEFTFTEAGEFKLVCVIPGHEALGMVGTIVVE